MLTELASPSVESAIRGLLADAGRLRTDPAMLSATDDLYAAGLSSLATVDVMLAIEDHFGVEFTDDWLNRRTFASIAALGKAVRSLQDAVS